MKAVLTLDTIAPPSPDQVDAVQAALAECGVVADTALAAPFSRLAAPWEAWADGDCILGRLSRTVWTDMLVAITAAPMYYKGVGGRALGLALIGKPRMVIAAYALEPEALRATVHHEFLHTLGYTHCPGYFGPCVMAPRLGSPTLDLCVRCRLAY